MSTPSPPGDANTELLQRLFARGLGEELILHVAGDSAILGQLGLRKNRLTLSDTRYLTGVRPQDVAPCFEAGVLGMVSAASKYQWSSLTFHGLHQCNVKVDLSQTRGSRLQATRDPDGEDLLDFVGSVYRGFGLLLDHHFLPVVTLQRMQAKDGEWGFAVVDLRMAALDLAAVRVVNDVVRRSTERHLEVDLIEEKVQDDQFEQLFGTFLGDTARRPPAPPRQSAPAARQAPAPSQSRGATPTPNVVVPISSGATARTPVPARLAAAGIAPAEVMLHVLGMMREVIAEVGAQRAFALFERWAGTEAEALARRLRQSEERELRTVQDYFDAIAVRMLHAGETLVLLEEKGGVLTHEVHNCIYREACRESGIDPEGRWSTCGQVIPNVRGRAAAALDPRLQWTWTSCDRRAGHPCVFEMKLSHPGG
jgi:hypothetical protein